MMCFGVEKAVETYKGVFYFIRNDSAPSPVLKTTIP